ncbi:cytochrome P450 [Nannocystaceae bacterium ST9]
MALVTTLALAGLALAAGYALALVAVNGRRRPGEPPLITGPLPFLGVGLEFGRDAMAMLARTRETHGEVFTLFVAGQRMTFVADPLSFPDVLKAKSLSFSPIAEEVMHSGFGLHGLHELTCVEQLEDASRSYLKGQQLSPLTERMEQRLRGLIVELGEGLDDRGRELPLHRLIWDLMFAAGTDALFGEGLTNPAAAKWFEDFDRQFPLRLAGMPEFMVAEGSAGLTKLSVLLAGEGRDPSEWMARRYELLAGVDDDRRGRIQTAVLWAAHANTIPAAFWTLAQLLREPAALASVRAELDAIAGPADAEGRPPPLPLATLDRLRMLDSAVREALRLSSGSLTVRKVTEPFRLTTRVGEFELRRGDRVCLAPWLTHHDPEIFAEPDRYRFDRFFSETGVEQFHKRGERVGFALMPFGAGRSMCPGRFFAIAEIKLLVALMLARFDLELADDAWPQLDLTRVGLGIHPPKTELSVRLRRRALDPGREPGYGPPR